MVRQLRVFLADLIFQFVKVCEDTSSWEFECIYADALGLYRYSQPVVQNVVGDIFTV